MESGGGEGAGGWEEERVESGGGVGTGGWGEGRLEQRVYALHIGEHLLKQ